MKNSKVLFCLALSVTLMATTHAAEGVLEKGAPYSALISVSPESGDLIGYAFKNESGVGKAILKNCLPGLSCKLEKSTLRRMDNTPPLKTTPEPSGWIEITSARNPAMQTTVFGYEKTAKSRYGVLSIRDDNILMFKAKPVQPTIEGNNSLSIVASYELGKDDVFLLQNSGGTACPALYTFVTISAAGVRATPEFGTCSDIIYPTSDLKTGVTVVMVGFTRFSSTVAQQRTAAMTQTVYQLLTSGKLSKNGLSIVHR